MLLKISKFFVYLSLFAVIVVLSTIFFPFIGGKYAFFRICTELSLLFFLLWWAFQAKPKDLKGWRELLLQPIPIAVTVFVIIYLLAAIFALDAHAAFWSNYERGDGAFQMLHYYILYLMALFTLRTEKDWRRAFWVSITAALLVIGYGVAGALGISGFIGYQPGGFIANLLSPNNRFEGSLGNSAYIPPYLMFIGGYTFYLWWTSRRKLSTSMKIWYIALLLIFALFFALSDTRGAFIGLFAGIAAFILYVGFSRPAWRKKLAVIIVALVIVGGGLYSLRNTKFVQSLPGNRVFTISLSDPSAQTRIWTWGSAWKGFLERPVLGWGPENFTAVFDKYFDTRHFIPGQNTETWFDRAHSVVFDYLAETGLLGLLAYLSLFVVYYYQLFDFTRKKKKAEPSPGTSKGKGRATISVAVIGILVALPVAYFVQGLALFDVLATYMNLFLLLAFMTYEFPTKSVAFYEIEKKS